MEINSFSKGQASGWCWASTTQVPAPIAMYREGDFDVPADLIEVPTLFIAGKQDGCLLPELSDGQEAIFTDKYERELWPDVGHFPHLEQPTRAAEAIAKWFAETRA